MCLFSRRYWIRIYAMAWPFLGSKCSFQSAKRILSGNIISVSHYHCEYAKTISSQTLRYPESGKHWLPFYWNPFGILALNTYQIKQILFVNLSTHLGIQVASGIQAMDHPSHREDFLALTASWCISSGYPPCFRCFTTPILLTSSESLIPGAQNIVGVNMG